VPVIGAGTGAGVGVGVGVGVGDALGVGVGTGSATIAGVGVGVAIEAAVLGVTVELNRPAAAYRYGTPYNDATLAPSTMLMRYHEDPATALSPQVADQALPATLVVTSTGVSVGRTVVAVSALDGPVRRFTRHAAYRVTGGGTKAVNLLV
jgi:hypothetical protein